MSRQHTIDEYLEVSDVKFMIPKDVYKMLIFEGQKKNESLEETITRILLDASLQIESPPKTGI